MTGARPCRGAQVFSHGAVSRALCCRAGSLASDIRAPYRLNHPMIFYVGDEEVAGQQEPAGHGGHKMSAVAWCWSEGDENPEVLDCRNGRPIHALQFAGVTSEKGAKPAVLPGVAVSVAKELLGDALSDTHPEGLAQSGDDSSAGSLLDVDVEESKSLAPAKKKSKNKNKKGANANGGGEDGDDDDEDTNDAVSELNHCTQMNAWPVATYVETTEARIDADKEGRSGHGMFQSEPTLAFAQATPPPGGWQAQALVAQEKTMPGAPPPGGIPGEAPFGLLPGQLSEVPPDCMPLAGGDGIGGSLAGMAGMGVSSGGTGVRAHGAGSHVAAQAPPALPNPMCAKMSAGAASWTPSAQYVPQADSPGPVPGQAQGLAPKSAAEGAAEGAAAAGTADVSHVVGEQGPHPGSHPSLQAGARAAARLEVEERVGLRLPGDHVTAPGVPVNGTRLFSMLVRCEVRGEEYTASGIGPSKKRAKQTAARQMLAKLTSLIGPVLSRPTSLVSGSEMLRRYKTIVEASEAPTEAGGMDGFGFRLSGGGTEGGSGGWPSSSKLAEMSYRQAKVRLLVSTSVATFKCVSLFLHLISVLAHYRSRRASMAPPSVFSTTFSQGVLSCAFGGGRAGIGVGGWCYGTGLFC